MTAKQAEKLKRLAKAAYELDAFKPNLTRAEADRRIAARLDPSGLRLLGIVHGKFATPQRSAAFGPNETIRLLTCRG